MLSSMTGFGRVDAQIDGRRVTVEIRSVNHRYLEMTCRLPRILAALESRIQETVQKRVTRGKISIAVTMEGEIVGTVAIRVDHDLASRYLELAKDLKETHNLKGDLDIQSLLTLPDVLTREEENFSEEQSWSCLAPALVETLEKFTAMRQREGEALARDLMDRIQAIRATVDRIQTHVPAVVAQVRERLRARLAEISGDAEYNRYRLEAEVALFADRSDVTEECVRLRSHCDQFAEFVADSQPAGRRLKFLLEEMHREVNTIGSKGQDTEISREVLFLKEEVERIREQVLNIE
jgi:uncharacterized protein (TIGR00255 family)